MKTDEDGNEVFKGYTLVKPAKRGQPWQVHSPVAMWYVSTREEARRSVNEDISSGGPYGEGEDESDTSSLDTPTQEEADAENPRDAALLPTECACPMCQSDYTHENCPRCNPDDPAVVADDGIVVESHHDPAETEEDKLNRKGLVYFRFHGRYALGQMQPGHAFHYGGRVFTVTRVDRETKQSMTDPKEHDVVIVRFAHHAPGQVGKAYVCMATDVVRPVVYRTYLESIGEKRQARKERRRALKAS